MNILIVGAGSLGMLFAGKLSEHTAAAVSLLARSKEQAAKVNGEGLTVVENGHPNHVSLPCFSFEETGDLTSRWDWVLLTTKQTHIDAPLIKYLTSVITGGTKLLCFQNGVGHVERLAKAGMGRKHIYLAVTTEAAKRENSHTVIHTGEGTTSIGCAAEHGGDTAAIQAMCDLLQEAGFDSVIAQDIEQMVWKKLLINSVINPLTAIMGIRNGELLSSPQYLESMAALYEEACMVLQGYGMKVLEQLWEDLLQVCQKTSANTSSMLQDLQAGRETEIESINGSIIRLAAEQQLRVPAHEAVYQMVKRLESKN